MSWSARSHVAPSDGHLVAALRRRSTASLSPAGLAVVGQATHDRRTSPPPAPVVPTHASRPVTNSSRRTPLAHPPQGLVYPPVPVSPSPPHVAPHSLLRSLSRVPSLFPTSCLVLLHIRPPSPLFPHRRNTSQILFSPVPRPALHPPFKPCSLSNSNLSHHHSLGTKTALPLRGPGGSRSRCLPGATKDQCGIHRQLHQQRYHRQRA